MPEPSLESRGSSAFPRLVAAFVVAAGLEAMVLPWIPDTRARSAVAGLVPVLLGALVLFTLRPRGTPAAPHTPLHESIHGAEARLDPRVDGLVAQLERVREGYYEQLQRSESLRASLAEEIRLQNSQLVRENRELAHTDRMKDEFISMLAHELQTPLTAIRSYVEILTGYGGNLEADDRRAFLDVIQVQTQHLSRLIAEMLDLSRVRSGRFKIESHEVAIGPVVATVVDAMRAVAQESGHVLEVSDLDAPLVARCDPDRVRQILTNLVSNALKYAPQASNVRIEASKAAAGMVRIAVIDRGPGIPADERGLLFSPFYRTRSARQSTTDGTGLGLYLSREIARQMRGDLQLDETLGGGATFALLLPTSVAVDDAATDAGDLMGAAPATPRAEGRSRVGAEDPRP